VKGLLATPRPRLFAHRGGAALAPENTLPAFDAAARLGIVAFELDVRLTRDGEVVVFHDEGTSRITGAAGTVEERSLEELRSLDAGFSFSPDGGATHPWRGRGVRIPTLRELLERHRRAAVNVEAKHPAPALAAALVDVIRSCGAVERACLGSELDEQGERIRALLPEAAHFLPTEAATCHVLAAKSGADPASCPAGWDVADLPHRWNGMTVADREVIDWFHARGVQVHVWTVDDPEDMRELLAAGVDGIMTDRPDLALEVVRG
jgi:glycerophosphoryl diester phosphodiesterase